jgi:hypothetical protein
MASNVALMGVAGRDCYTRAELARSPVRWRLNSPISDPELYPLPLGRSKQSNDVLCFYSEVNFFTPGDANLIRVGPAVFSFRYHTGVRCTVSVA